MLPYMHMILVLFIFLACGGDTASVKGLKKSSNIDMDINNYPDLEKLKNEAKTRSILINRNVSKDFIKTEPLNHELSILYTLPPSMTCRDLRKYPTLMEGSGDFYKIYMESSHSVGCTDINYVNTDHSGDDILIIAYGKNILEKNSSSNIELLGPPEFPNISSLIEDANDYFKNPNASTIMTERSFDLRRIRQESRARTRKVMIIRNITQNYYKNNILKPNVASTSYDISSNDITCKKISSDYVFRKSIYEYNLVTFPNHIIKDYHKVWNDSWCKEWDLINTPQSGKKSFLLTY